MFWVCFISGFVLVGWVVFCLFVCFGFVFLPSPLDIDWNVSNWWES